MPIITNGKPPRSLLPLYTSIIIIVPTTERFLRALVHCSSTLEHGILLCKALLLRSLKTSLKSRRRVIMWTRTLPRLKHDQASLTSNVDRYSCPGGLRSAKSLFTGLLELSRLHEPATSHIDSNSHHEQSIAHDPRRLSCLSDVSQMNSHTC